MSTRTKNLLGQLNELRIQAGRPPLKVWKGSYADLEKTIEELTPKKKTETKSPAPVKKGRKTVETMTVAEYCTQNGLNPKVARAKLRKSGLKKEGPWTLTAEVKSILMAS